MAQSAEPLAILPKSMGQPGGAPKKKTDQRKHVPAVKGGLLLNDPEEEECPYTFSDSPAYLRQKKELAEAKRAVELESKDDTRGFLKGVEELARRQKWDEALQVLERRTAVPSGLFLVTRAVLRWKFGRYSGALRDAEEALSKYGSSTKAGPLAAAFESFARICLGSEPRSRGSCGKEMKELVLAWEEAELRSLETHALGQGLFQPRAADRLAAPTKVVDGMEAQDGTYLAASGVRVGYVLLLNRRHSHAPFVVHFHGCSETAADYRDAAVAERYRDVPAHLLVVDFRGYGWSAGEPSLSALLRDAEPLAEKLPEIMLQSGLSWPYPGGLVLSGRALGAQVAVHLATLFPELFRSLALDSALATSATGDRLGRAQQRSAALSRWRKELDDANLEILQPLDSDLWCLSVLEKIKAYDGQLLVLHGLVDELAPREGGESLHATCGARRKELVLVEGAGHSDLRGSSEFWAALRSLALKAQLDDELPSVGPTVQHLCAVCTEKTTNKCGRCMKVWYCSRSCQAEHWKTHKRTCTGVALEPKPKVEPAGEACVVAAMAVQICSDADAAALSSALLAVGAQEESLEALYLSWHASSEELVARVADVLSQAREAAPSLKMQARQWPLEPRPQGQFQLLQELLPALSEAPPHAWIVFPEQHGFWSPRNVAVLQPALRRAAPDQRVAALCCRLHARPKEGERLRLQMAMQVEAALASGAAVREQAAEPGLAEVAVRLKTFQVFMEATPAAALAHELCLHRFMYRLRNTFGKKVQDFSPPDGEWMRWSSSSSASSSASPATDGDLALGADLLRGFGAGLPVEGASAEGLAPFASEAEAAATVAELRRQIERSVVLNAGESMQAQELRSLAMDRVVAFLEAAGLRHVVGIQRWAKAAATELSTGAARLFQVQVVSKDAQ